MTTAYVYATTLINVLLMFMLVLDEILESVLRNSNFLRSCFTHEIVPSLLYVSWHYTISKVYSYWFSQNNADRKFAVNFDESFVVTFVFQLMFKINLIFVSFIFLLFLFCLSMKKCLLYFFHSYLLTSYLLAWITKLKASCASL